MIIVGSVMTTMSRRQVTASESISENTYKRHAYHLANAYAELAVKELGEFLHGGADILPSYVDHDHSRYIENSIVNVHVEAIPSSDPEHIGDDYKIVSIADVHAPDGSIFRAHTEVIFTFAEVYDSDSDLNDSSYLEDDPTEYPQASDGVLYASKKSDVYHFPTCRYIKTIKKVNLITFVDEDDALSKNYRHCKVCHDLIINPPPIEIIIPSDPTPHPTEYVEGIRYWDEKPVQVIR
jgi:hypothetical protein